MSCLLNDQQEGLQVGHGIHEGPNDQHLRLFAQNPLAGVGFLSGRGDEATNQLY